ncbi:MAG: class I SAM-dependent methyltransferase [Candidatus Nitrosocaldaceae archaeon]|nr:MAG: class I SAM-dependent methyltransferase [Candidatus Nitrosocaldaceae archaeon]GIU72386.1 MAG: class I SAM-dependent methyltransferase [Candidatus Nitrosocaldaceae archaeon]
MSEYIFGSTAKELLRLELQAELFEPYTKHTLELAGIKKGMKCVDFGCGNGYTAILLAKLVGKDGKVIAIDTSKDALLVAEKNAKRLGIDNIEFIQTDAYNTSLKDNYYDLIFSRFLFTHISEPKKVLEEMIRITKDNGIIVTEDFNHELRITYPYNKYIERLRTALIELLKKSGSKYDIAGMLYRLFKEHGLDAKVDVYAVPFSMNDKRYRVLPLLFAEVLRDRFMKYGIIDEEEYNNIINGINEYMNIKDAIVLYSSVFRVYAYLI